MLPPKQFHTVKQPRGSKVCAACVAAMAAGASLEEVESAMTPTELPDGTHFYRTAEVLRFLGGRGIYCGLTFDPNSEITEDQVSLSFSTEICLIERPALLCVRSRKYENAEHYVFWDGERVRDPSPDMPETSPITGYFVIEIVPLTYIDDTAEIDQEKLLKLVAESAN